MKPKARLYDYCWARHRCADLQELLLRSSSSSSNSFMTRYEPYESPVSAHFLSFSSFRLFELGSLFMSLFPNLFPSSWPKIYNKGSCKNWATAVVIAVIDLACYVLYPIPVFCIIWWDLSCLFPWTCNTLWCCKQLS